MCEGKFINLLKNFIEVKKMITIEEIKKVVAEIAPKYNLKKLHYLAVVRVEIFAKTATLI